MPQSPFLLFRRPLVRTAVALAALAAAGCTDPTDPDDADDRSTLDAREAQVVASALFAEVSSALAGSAFAARSAADVAVPRPAAAAALETMSINEPCSAGGRLGGTLTFNDNTDRNGTGAFTGSMVVTPQGCMVSTGTRTLAINGNPSLSYTFNQAFVRGEPSGDFVWRATGGFRWADGSCALDYTVRITPQGSGSISGTMCGESISSRF